LAPVAAVVEFSIVSVPPLTDPPLTATPGLFPAGSGLPSELMVSPEPMSEPVPETTRAPPPLPFVVIVVPVRLRLPLP